MNPGRGVGSAEEFDPDPATHDHATLGGMLGNTTTVGAAALSALHRPERPTIEERRSRLRRRRRGGIGRTAAAVLGWGAAGLLFVLMALLITTGH